MRSSEAVKKVRFYKVLTRNGRACHGGYYKYDLPKNGKSGAWSEPIPHGDLTMCEHGYHVTDAVSLLQWYERSDLHHVYLAETRGIVTPDLVNDDKVVCSSIRLVRRVTVTPAFRKLWTQLNDNILNDSSVKDSLKYIVRDDRRLDKLLAGSAK